MMLGSDLNAQVAKLEKDCRNLQIRLEKLEGRRGWFPALLANVLLLLMAGLFADYFGFFPPMVDRLPLHARTIETEELTLRDRAGTVVRLVPDANGGIRSVDTAGNPLPSRAR